MRVFIYLLVLCLNFVFAQEICTNGIDDDSDGLIDLNDNECTCSATISGSLIPNGSFEIMNCCPTGNSQVNCAQNWVDAASTSDYFNTCGYMPTFHFPTPPSGYNGNGFTGFWNQLLNNGNPYKEYIGVCLSAPMQAGQTYNLTGMVGFGVFSGTPGGAPAPTSPFNLAVYGNADCDNLPIDISSSQCPLASPQNWILLGTVSVSGNNQWTNFTLPITPGIDINAIALGSDCNNPTIKNYYYLDNLGMAAPFPVISHTGEPCDGDVVLRVNPSAGYSIQWYKDSIAIVGANAVTYTVPAGSPGNGIYQCRLSSGGLCGLSNTYTVSTGSFTPVITASPGAAICPGTPVLLDTEDAYETTTWSTGETRPPITVLSPGFYTVTASNGAYCTGFGSILIENFSTNITSPDLSLCVGESTVLTANTNMVASAGCGLAARSCSPPAAPLLVGINNSSASIPFDGFPSTKIQMIFTAAELVAAGIQSGIIDGMGLMPVTAGTTYQNVTISLGCTSQSQWSGFGTFLPSPTLVYTGNFDLNSPFVSFNAPYQWDGVQNLLVEICYDQGTGTYNVAEQHFVRCTSALGIARAIYAENLSNVCAMNTGTMSIFRPLAFFSNCSAPLTAGSLSYSWSPSTGLDDPTIASPEASPNTTTTYTVTISNGQCSVTDNITVTSNICLGQESPILTAQVLSASTISLSWIDEHFASAQKYLLERSENAEKDFEALAEIISEHKKDYSWNDFSPLPKAYYRIKKVGEDAEFYYSNTVEVLLSEDYQPFLLYPSPATETINIENLGILEEGWIKIYDMQGKMVLRANLEREKVQEIDISQLTGGLYHVSIQTSEGNFYTYPLLKQ